MNKILDFNYSIFLKYGIILFIFYILFNSNFSYASNDFRIFDAMNFKKKPDLTVYGLEEIKIIYSGELWHKNEDRVNTPRLSRLKKILNHSRTTKDGLLIFDVEHWKLTGKDNLVEESINKYIEIINQARNINNNISYGYYGMVPIRDYWRAKQKKGNSKKNQWHKENDKLMRFADSVDALYPSIYTFYTDIDGWIKYAEANLIEAKRLAKGKPVYAFVMPFYHDSNKLRKGQLIDKNYWAVQLETIFCHADGIVIWSGNSRTWSNDSDWWLETQKFIKALDVKNKSTCENDI